MASEDNSVIKRMLERFKLSADAESENRKRGLAALKFRQGGDAQWDNNILTVRREDQRPTESYNQIPQFVHQVTNEMRINMPQTKFVPGNEGSKEVAEIYEGLARTIQASSEAEVAYDNAADSQVTIGWAYWRYVTEFVPGKTWDQIIKIQWVPNTFTVYDDPFTTMQDRSDRKFLIQVCDVAVEDFNKEYGKEYDSFDLDSIGDESPEWAGQNTVRVAEYWEVVERKTMLYRQNGVITDVKPESGEYEEREVINNDVYWYKCTAKDILDKKKWNGSYIPYVFVSGEMLIVDGKTIYTGLVEALMSSQKQYNYWTNAATEMVALTPKAPYIAAVGQLSGNLAAIWDKANVKNYPYLPYNPVTINGSLAPAPQRNSTGMDISSMLALVNQAQQNFYATSGIYPASLGKTSNETSGKAIIARQKEGDVSTFHFQDNLARGLRAGGRIMEDLIKRIYDGSRVLRLLNEDKSHRDVRVNEPYVDERTGETVMHDLTVGTYDVMVTTGPSYTTKRQEAQESMAQIIQSDPSIMQKAPDIIVSSFDWPGADKLAERLKKFLPPGIADPEEGEMQEPQIPPEVQAQMQQAQAMIEQSGQAIQQLQAQLQQCEDELKNKQYDFALKKQAEDNKFTIEQYKVQQKDRELDIKEQEILLKQQPVMQDKQPQQSLKLDTTGFQFAKTPEQEAMDAQEEQMEAEQENARIAVQMQLKQDEIDQSRHNTEAVLEALSGVKNALEGLTAEVGKPVVMRRGDDGLVSTLVKV